ncbi:MAG: hypothetical protein D6729_14560 [Deltaproteobacteria bacterium]|nr:MAG: hypothetical protein D6729_14560 [Deltaproteobacteria bacterium]
MLLAVIPFGVQAAPMELGYQGRLLSSDGTPVEGTKTITFALYTDADVTDPTQQPSVPPVWTEDQTLALSRGFYATQLGVVTPLTSDLFDGDPLWLLLTVDGEPLLPLQKVTSVAYAIRADTATNVVGGTVDASRISVNGNSVVDSNGQIDLASAIPPCQPGEVLQWDGNNNTWGCGAVSGTLSAGAGIDLTGSTISLGPCPNDGDVWKVVGGAWVCAPDANSGGTITGVAAGTGLAGGGASGDVTLSIANGGVGTAQLKAGAVSTGKIANGAVTNPKIAANSIGSGKIADGTIATADLADGAVTTAKMGFSHRLTLNDNLASGVYDDATSNAPYSQISADSFHTNGLGVGQIFIEGQAIDSNSTIYIGAGLAGGQPAEPVVLGGNVTVNGDTTLGGAVTVNDGVFSSWATRGAGLYGAGGATGLVANGWFEEGTKGWTGWSGVTLKTGQLDSAGGTAWAENKAATRADLRSADLIPVNPDLTYTVHAAFRWDPNNPGSAGVIYLRLLQYDASGSWIGDRNLGVEGVNLTDHNWHTYSRSVGKGSGRAFATGTRYVRLRALLNWGSVAGNKVYQVTGLALTQGLATNDGVVDLQMHRVTASCTGINCTTGSPSCPAGEHVISGGCAFTNCPQNGLDHNYPDSTLTKWICQSNQCSSTVGYAICANVR